MMLIINGIRSLVYLAVWFEGLIYDKANLKADTIILSLNLLECHNFILVAL